MRIYAGNLAPEVTEIQLKECFTKHGKVDSCQLSVDKGTGTHKGIGFIEMPNDTEANAAIAALNGSLLGGKPITVSEAKLKTESAGAAAHNK